MKYLFFLLAIVGWVVSLVVHILSVAGIDISTNIPWVWALHAGIFIVWIAAILFLRGDQRIKELLENAKRRGSKPGSSLKLVLQDIPTLVSSIAIAGFVYAIFNFLFCAFTGNGSAAIRDGQYILHSHGQLIKQITAQEYHHIKAKELRMFSGHWIAFYGIAVAILYNAVYRIAKPASQNISIG